MVLLLITILLFLPYALLLLDYARAWKKIPGPGPAANPPHTQVSVVIPARNEDENIGRLLVALAQQSYPSGLFEVIVVDDHSTDNTAGIIRQFPAVRLVQLGDDKLNAYKKKAIETGIAAAAGRLIVTTDADCTPPPGWLDQLVAAYENQRAVMVVAPVVIESDRSLLQEFQAMDFMMLQGITGAVVHRRQMTMCNGANLAYEKEVFYETGGFSGIDHIASGDDMLLMHKVAKLYPEGIQYLKSKQAIVATRPAASWHAFIQQRIRWASKATHYDDKRILPVLFLVYLFNLTFPAWVVAGFLDARGWLVLLLLWTGKTLVEFPLFMQLSAFFNRSSSFARFLLFQPLHILYTLLSGLFGQFGKYEWKGRMVR